jgi:hypothetical protein
MNLLFENMVDDRGAKFSACNNYRYALWRIWDKSKPLVMCIGLNPSKATKVKNDRTITRLESLIKNAGYGGFYMMNLFAYITPYPKQLKYAQDLQGDSNKCFTEISAKCKDVVFCWGGFNILSLYEMFADRVEFMEEMYAGALCFGFCNSGAPRHPLMLKKDTPLIKFGNSSK